jgi:hypothetical protein
MRRRPNLTKIMVPNYDRSAGLPGKLHDLAGGLPEGGIGFSGDGPVS